MRHYVMEIVDDTVTNAEGFRLYAFLNKKIRDRELAELSFKDVQALSSSFLNSSVGALVSDQGFEKLKAYIKFVDLKQSVATQLKSYLNSCGCVV